jgi:hypothetical protein
MAEYVVYPQGTLKFSLASAKTEARRQIREDREHRAYVENRYTGKTVYDVDYDEVIHSRRKNPRRVASIPVGKKIKVNYIVVDAKGRVSASIPTPRVRNTEGFKDARGIFHPIRSGDDYDPEDVGERRAYAPRKKRATKRKAAKRRKR